MEIFNWVLAHWVDILAAVGGVVTAASIIAKLTPTPKDDAWVAKVVKAIDWLALNTPRERK